MDFFKKVSTDAFRTPHNVGSDHDNINLTQDTNVPIVADGTRRDPLGSSMSSVSANSVNAAAAAAAAASRHEGVANSNQVPVRDDDASVFSDDSVDAAASRVEGGRHYTRVLYRQKHHHLHHTGTSFSSNESDGWTNAAAAAAAASSPRASCPAVPKWLLASPLSYFDLRNTRPFSWRNELLCLHHLLFVLYSSLDEDCMPWFTDFGDPNKLRLPQSTKEALSRINLNFPYYSTNYLHIFYSVTVPFLLMYNWPFLVVFVIFAVLGHLIALEKRHKHIYGSEVVLLGRCVRYRTLGHAALTIVILLVLFSDVLRTVFWVLLLNATVIVPHAMCRISTYFDDEDLEKLRPRLTLYALSLLFVALAYLEGDVNAPENEGKRAAKREMDRLGLTELFRKHNMLRRMQAD